MRRGLAGLGLLLLAAAPARAAESTLTEAQQAQLDQLRAEVAAQLQLQAYDLLDELVFGWIEQPVFASETPVVLADVRAPVGYGTGLQALLENHLTGLVLRNPKTHVVLAHCPQCTAVVVHAGAKGTLVSRGVDQPETLASAGRAAGSRHALFLDFEAEGPALVLRARITGLEPSLPIVYAKTLSTTSTRPALLRSGERLKSATEARQEYVSALEGRGSYVVPLRVVVRGYAPGNDASIIAPPFIWLQGGVETSLTQARAWTGSFSLGVSWLPELHTAWLAQARISRLVTGSAASLTRPDLYGFVGGSVISIHGPTSLIFRDEVPNLPNAIAALRQSDPSIIFAAFQLGLELRVKNRIGASVFLEYLPAMNNAPGIGRYIDLGIIQFHSFGAEVSFCF